MFPFPYRKQIPLADVIFTLFNTDSVEKGLPHICEFVFVFFCLAQCLKFFLCEIAQIILTIFWMHTGCFAVVIDDHPVFRRHSVSKMRADQHDHIASRFQMADIYLRIQTLKTGKLLKVVCLVRYSAADFQELYHMRVRVLTKYGAASCKPCSQKIINCLQSIFFCR